MQRFRSSLAIVAGVSLALAGAACDGSSPLGPTNGSDDSPGDVSQMTGVVESASQSGGDPTEGTIVLAGGIQVRVTSQTTIDAGGDLTSLEAALSAIQSGTPVRIELEGTLEGGVFTATRIRFETDDSSSGSGSSNDDDDDDDDDQDEVHGVVASVDLATRIVTLADGRVIRVVTDGLIEGDGDFLTLAQVQAAVAAGLEVRLEADGGIGADGVFEVTSAKFESDQADGPGDDDDDDDDNSGPGNADDDDDDDDADEIHGIVASVDLAARTVTLADGRLLRVGNDALIEVDGDFLTLAGVLAAVEAGLEVELEADGAFGADGVFEVTSAKFESDQADGPGDDDDDDDNSGPGNGDDDDDDDNSGPGNGDDDDDNDDEVHGIVASVDLGGRTVTLADGRLIRIPSDSVIELDGDIDTLSGVQAQLSLGATIRVEADGAFDGGAFLATAVKFEID